MTTNIANSSGYAVLSNKNTIGNVDPIGTNYTMKLNAQEITVKLIVSVSEDSGYQGYLYENLSNRELYVVHEGSIDPFNGNADEIKKDWTITNTGMLAASNIPAQFDDSKKFLDAVKNSSVYKDRKIIQIGQSLGGSLAEMNGALKENEKIETITFNSLGVERMGTAIVELRKLELSGNYDNISNFAYLNEAVSKIAPHFGEIYIAKDYCTDGNLVHSTEFHQKDGLIYHYEDNYFTVLQHIPSGYELKLTMNTLTGDLTLVLKASP